MFFMTELIFVACKTTIVDLGNKFLKILNGIRLPLLLVTILCYMPFFD